MQQEIESSQNVTGSANNSHSDASFPECCWRYSWYNLALIVLLTLIFAAIMAGIVSVVLHFATNIKQAYIPLIWGGAMALPAIYFLWSFCAFCYMRLIQSYTLSSNDFRFSSGFFNRSSSSMLLHPIWGMKLQQSFVQRLFGLGTIIINSPDTSSERFIVKGLGDMPSRFFTLEEYRHQAMEKLRTRPLDPQQSPDPIQWRYSGFDLIDESIWGIVITAIIVCVAVFTPVSSLLPIPSWVTYLLLSILPVLYWLNLASIFIDKIMFTSYTLTPSSLEKRSGIFNKKYEVFSLFHLTDCEMSQNLWQRIMNVGNIILYLKWDSQDDSTETDETSKTDKPDKKIHTIVLHGLPDYAEKFSMLQDYRTKEQQSHVAGSL